MEDLTKQQIVLVTLLVSFVTSIATGIVTVALMDQAPKGITNTINHVVERTIEKVVPGDSTASVVTQVISTVEDTTANAVEKAERSVVRIKRIQGSIESAPVVSLGVVGTKNVIIADKSRITADGSYVIQFFDGTEIPVTKVQVLNDNDFALLSFVVPADKVKSLDVIPATFGSDKSIRRGQSVLLLTGSSSWRVQQGIIQEITRAEGTPSIAEADRPILSLVTNLGHSAPDNGSPLVDMKGDIIGITTLRISDGSEGVFLPSTSLTALRAQIEAFVQ